MTVKKSPSLFATFELTLNTINHVLIGSVSIYMTWLCFSLDYSLFTLHVLFCTLGYQLLMAEAIMALYSGNTWSSLLLRRNKNIGHLSLQILGAGLSISGTIIEIYLKGWKVTWKGNHAIFGEELSFFFVSNG